MKPLEERLRDAMNAAGEIVPEREPRPLPVAGRRRRRFPLGFPPWGMQLRVAAAVMAVLVISVATRVVIGDPDPPDKEPGMPRFFVATYYTPEGEKDQSRLEVRETTTGRLLDSRSAPAGENFRDVTAAGDGVFYVTSEQQPEKPCRTTIYRVKVNGSGTITGLEPIPGEPRPGTTTDAGSLAATPDGRRAAVTQSGCDLESKTDRPTLTLFDPATGRPQRQWRAPAGSSLSWLTWSADGRYLFFFLLKPGWQVEELRRIDTSGTVRDLVRDSSLIRTSREPRRFGAMAAAPDGRQVHVVMGEEAVASSMPPGGSDTEETSPSPERRELELLEISAETGRTERVIRRPGAETTVTPVLKSDASGRYLFTDLGILDLRGGGPLRGVPSMTGVFDVAW